MKVVLLFIYLINGEVEKVPVTLAVDQTCTDKLMEMVTTNEEETRILYKKQIVFAHYCKTEDVEWIR